MMLFVALPFCDQTNDLALSSRQRGLLNIIVTRVPASHVFSPHEFSLGRREKRLVLSQGINGRNERVFQDEPSGVEAVQFRQAHIHHDKVRLTPRHTLASPRGIQAAIGSLVA